MGLARDIQLYVEFWALVNWVFAFWVENVEGMNDNPPMDGMIVGSLGQYLGYSVSSVNLE